LSVVDRRNPENYSTPEQLAYRRVAAAVDLARAVPLQSGKMCGSRVALVPIQSILRVELVQTQHFRVARRLGQYRCGADDWVFLVSKILGNNMCSI